MLYLSTVVGGDTPHVVMDCRQDGYGVPCHIDSSKDLSRLRDAWKACSELLLREVRQLEEHVVLLRTNPPGGDICPTCTYMYKIQGTTCRYNIQVQHAGTTCRYEVSSINQSIHIILFSLALCQSVEFTVLDCICTGFDRWGFIPISLVHFSVIKFKKKKSECIMGSS